MTNEYRQLAKRLQCAYRLAQNSDTLTQSERDTVTKRIREPFVYNLSASAQKGLDDQTEARRAAKKSVEESPYCFE
jgi:hypothetical protein